MAARVAELDVDANGLEAGRGRVPLGDEFRAGVSRPASWGRRRRRGEAASARADGDERLEATGASCRGPADHEWTADEVWLARRIEPAAHGRIVAGGAPP